MHVPAFFKRHVFVKVAPGANMDPSGIDTSLTNCARSHMAVGGVVGAGRTGVGNEATVVFVATMDGRVGVLNDSVGVNCACMVCAAAVNTTFGSSVAGALDGKLHAETINMITVNIEVLRISLYILFSSFWK